MRDPSCTCEVHPAADVCGYRCTTCPVHRNGPCASQATEERECIRDGCSAPNDGPKSAEQHAEEIVAEVAALRSEVAEWRAWCVSLANSPIGADKSDSYIRDAVVADLRELHERLRNERDEASSEVERLRARVQELEELDAVSVSGIDNIGDALATERAARENAEQERDRMNESLKHIVEQRDNAIAAHEETRRELDEAREALDYERTALGDANAALEETRRERDDFSKRWAAEVEHTNAWARKAWAAEATVRRLTEALRDIDNRTRYLSSTEARDVGLIVDAALATVAPSPPTRPHHLAWNGTEWTDARCGCRYHPDDDNGTHGGAPHVHRCERHAARPIAPSPPEPDRWDALEAAARELPLGAVFHGGGLNDAPKFDVAMAAVRYAREGTGPLASIVGPSTVAPRPAEPADEKPWPRSEIPKGIVIDPCKYGFCALVEGSVGSWNTAIAAARSLLGLTLPSVAPSPPEPATPKPVPMVLHCPDCRARHVDAGRFATHPHHTHSCQNCGLTWRPAVVPTVGVQFLPGFKDESAPRQPNAPGWWWRDVEGEPVPTLVRQVDDDLVFLRVDLSTWTSVDVARWLGPVRWWTHSDPEQRVDVGPDRPLSDPQMQDRIARKLFGDGTVHPIADALRKLLDQVWRGSYCHSCAQVAKTIDEHLDWCPIPDAVRALDGRQP